MPKRLAIVFLSIFVFVFFFSGYSNEGPSKRKFKKLGEGVEDLTKVPEVKPEKNQLKEIAGDGRFKKWVEWWQKCSPNLNTNNMEVLSSAPIYDEPIKYLSSAEMQDGPQDMFYIKSPSGKYIVNPFFRRLSYQKETGDWQPYIKIPCGVALYDTKSTWARNIFDCSALEGIDDAFWKDKDRLVLMGYSSVSRQMNVECESTESCIAPTIWVVNVKDQTVSEHHGDVMKRKKCELGGYLKVRLPNFFGKEK